MHRALGFVSTVARTVFVTDLFGQGGNGRSRSIGGIKVEGQSVGVARCRHGGKGIATEVNGTARNSNAVASDDRQGFTGTIRCALQRYHQAAAIEVGCGFRVSKGDIVALFDFQHTTVLLHIGELVVAGIKTCDCRCFVNTRNTDIEYLSCQRYRSVFEAIFNGKGKAVAAGFRAIVFVGHVACVQLRLSKAAVSRQGRTAQL